MLICFITVAAAGFVWAAASWGFRVTSLLGALHTQIVELRWRVDELERRAGETEFHGKLHAELTRPTWDRPGGVWVPGVVPADDGSACRCRWGDSNSETKGAA